MSKYLPVGLRLKEERTRLKHNQDACAALGEVTRKTLFNYESGDTAPSGAFLLALNEHEYDVHYILLGERLAPRCISEALSPEETKLIDHYRQSTEEGRAALSRMAELEVKAKQIEPSGRSVVVIGSGHVVGSNNQTNTVIASGEPKARRTLSKSRK